MMINEVRREIVLRVVCFLFSEGFVQMDWVLFEEWGEFGVGMLLSRERVGVCRVVGGKGGGEGKGKVRWCVLMVLWRLLYNAVLQLCRRMVDEDGVHLGYAEF